MREASTVKLLLASLVGALIGGAIAVVSLQFIEHQNGKENGSKPLITTAELDKPKYSLGLANVQDIPERIFYYGGSTSWAPIRAKVDREIERVHPDFNLEYRQDENLAPGSGSGITMLLEDRLSIAQSSRSVKNSEYEEAVQKGFKLKQVPVAIDIIAIAVNPNLNIANLTVEQLKDIYTGKITNWNQVGSENLSTKPYSRPRESGTTEYFIKNVLQGDNLGGNVMTIPTTTEALREVAKNPGGIYFASASEIINQCSVKSLPISRHAGSVIISPYEGEVRSPEDCIKQPYQLNFEDLQTGQYPLTRSLFVVIKKNGRVDELAGEAYAKLLLTNEGQILIKKADFIPIRF